MPTRRATCDLARLEHALLPVHEADAYTSDTAPFAVGVAFTGQSRAVVGRPGEPSRTLDVLPGSAGVNGPRPLTWLRTAAVSESVEIVPTAAALASAAADHGVVWADAPDYRLRDRDPVVWAAAARVRRRLATGPAGGDDELVTALLAHVAVAWLGGREVRGSRLGAEALRAVGDRVHDDPWAPHRLADLAASAHLSPFHFLRSFRAATGTTPHAFVSDVRAEAVRRRLAAGATVSAVAGEVGVDPRQLRRLHRRCTGEPLRGHPR
ncbi:helix-turn-helix domain-containing protein [Geodermatophilus normandii]|uniref:Helix-turn-helix domain-containing protein n=1 Tax=Geodermatophilus normandii TaxID=1137989 RepID=A0A6P0GD52_9ACTN|nr:helix-turn-helix domain-containing protein [Geodermatophilus normandii]